MPQGHMFHYIHSGLIISNSQKIETVQMYPNSKMDTENVHLHNRILLAIKNKDIMSFAGKWMELENIILSEVTQTQKEMHGTYSLVSGY